MIEVVERSEEVTFYFPLFDRIMDIGWEMLRGILNNSNLNLWKDGKRKMILEEGKPSYKLESFIFFQPLQRRGVEARKAEHRRG